MGRYDQQKLFLEPLHETCPDIKVKFIFHCGGNATAAGRRLVRMISPTSPFTPASAIELMIPGNRAKLEKGFRVLTPLYCPEGQASFASEKVPAHWAC